IADANSGHPQEYFQTYRGADGQPMQRSESMKDCWFTLDQERREHAVLFTEYFDEVELKPGVNVRRVTLKTPVSGLGGVIFWPGRGGGGGNPPPGGKAPPPPRPVDTNTPTLFIQYAADIAPLEAQVAHYEGERDDLLANLESSSVIDLKQ